ncbi:MAG: hypothetical protein O2963_00080 [Proteobacteria bacterium]|nr:hypothetical protein [Pseudomonadota bacterium]
MKTMNDRLPGDYDRWRTEPLEPLHDNYGVYDDIDIWGDDDDITFKIKNKKAFYEEEEDD